MFEKYVHKKYDFYGPKISSIKKNMYEINCAFVYEQTNASPCFISLTAKLYKRPKLSLA